ncbi:MAG: RidA family protein [Caldilineaceae bacterium]
MTRQVITTTHAPAAIGPYSQAIKTDSLIFASGQLGLIPATGKLAEGVEAQARQALANVAALLQAAGSSMDQIVKTTIFLANLADFATVNAIYAQAFTGSPPARSTVQVAALPLGGLVEIEVIALCV